MKNYKLQEKINQYISSPREGIYNFELACEYFDIKQYASAMSYYLRCAELSSDEDLVYESLLCAWNCMTKVGGRPVFERGQLIQAISQSPHRPEGYYLLCSWLERFGSERIETNEELFHQMYLNACIGIQNKDNKIKFRYLSEYPGQTGLYFYKAYSGWNIGKTKEAEDLFIDMHLNHELDENFKVHVGNNIKNLGLEKKIK